MRKGTLVAILALGVTLGATIGALSAEAQTVDDFEDDDLAEYSTHNGDSADSTTQTTTVANGTYSLEINTDGSTSAHTIESTSGLGTYPSAGDAFSVWMRGSTAGNQRSPEVGFGTQGTGSNYRPDGYWANFHPGVDELSLIKLDGGSATTLASTAATTSYDTWYGIQVDWQTDGTIGVTLIDTSGSDVASMTGTDSTYTSGGVGFSIRPDAILYADDYEVGGNDAPNASFTHSCTDLNCSFNASGSSDSDGSITSYNWTFGDGNTSTGETTSHTYASEGIYTVNLTVTDDVGATDTTSQNVTLFTHHILDPDLTRTGFVDLSGLESGWATDQPSLFLRQRDVLDGTMDDHKLYRLDRDLGTKDTEPICRGASWPDGVEPAVLSNALTVTFEDRPVTACYHPGLDRHLLFLISSGADDSELVGKIQGTLSMSARTGNDVLAVAGTNVEGNEEVQQIDFFNLRQAREEFQTNDVAIGAGDNAWTAYTGNPGTRIRTAINGSMVIPTQPETWEAIEIIGDTLWTGSRQDGLHRYTIQRGSGLTETHHLPGWEIQDFDLSQRGRYLAVETGKNVSLWNATQMTTIATSNNTADYESTRGIALSPNNNYLYGASATTTFRYAVYNWTKSVEGLEGQQGELNPPPGTIVIDEEGVLSPETDDTTEEADKGTVYESSTQQMAALFGGSASAAGFFIAAIVISGLTAIVYTATTSGKAAIVGGATGAIFSTAIGWLPLWFLLVIALTGGGIIAWRR